MNLWITYFLRRFFFVALSAAILASTCSLGTDATLRSNSANFPNPFGLRVITLNLSHSVEHEPCSSLRHTDSPSQFVRTDTVFAVCNRPDRDKPFIQTQRAIFKNCSNLRTKLFPADLVLHHSAALDFSDFIRTALRTNRLIPMPLDFPHKFLTGINIGKVTGGLQKCFRGFHDNLQKPSAPAATSGKGLGKKCLVTQFPMRRPQLRAGRPLQYFRLQTPQSEPPCPCKWIPAPGGNK